MFSRVGFPAINRHPHSDSVPMFVRYPRHRLQSASSAATCAIGLDLGHGVSSVPPAAIGSMGHDPGHDPALAQSTAICAISHNLRGGSQENETK
jgi:hypothetical protein